MANPPLILASQSVERKRLLSILNLSFTTMPADVDESVLKHESPKAYVIRVARAKAAKISSENPGSVVIAADTPTVLGRRILQKAESRQEAITMMQLQSGRRVHIPTVVVVADASGKLSHKYVDSWVKLKRLTLPEIEEYLTRVDYWPRLAGCIAIEKMDHWMTQVHGSISGILGLPLYETSLLLRKAGIKVLGAA